MLGLIQWRRWCVCLSLGNLLTIQSWVAIFSLHRSDPATSVIIAGQIVALTLLTILLYLGVILVNVVRGNVKVYLKYVACLSIWILIFLNVIKPFLLPWLPLISYFGRGLPAILACLSVALIVLLGRHYRKYIQRTLISMALIMAPFAGIALGHAAYIGFISSGVAQTEQVKTVSRDFPRSPTSSAKNRVAIFVFDEFDFELAFVARPSHVRLRELDRFRNEFFFSTNAYPPMHSTSMSIPAMLTGRLVKDSKPIGVTSGDFQLVFENGDIGTLSMQKTIFSDARQLGLTSIRMSDVYFAKKNLGGSSDADWIIPSSLNESVSLFATTVEAILGYVRIIPFSNSLGIEQLIRSMLDVNQPSKATLASVDLAVDMISNADFDLIWAHILLPHLPTVFDVKRDQFSQVLIEDYFANLVAVDRVLSRTRKALESAGRWETTTFILVSDHFLRVKRSTYGLGDHKVPFIVKFSGNNNEPILFTGEFNLVLLREIVKLVLSGAASNGTQLSKWIGSNAKFGESPLTEYREGW